MSMQWLKPYMSRSHYTRAALILVLPVIVVLLVVSIAFLQRHLEKVTTQMTRSAAREVKLVLAVMEGAETQMQAPAMARQDLSVLAMNARFLSASDELQIGSRHRWKPECILSSLRQRGIALPDGQEVRLYLATKLGMVELKIDRRRLSPSAPHQLIVTMVFFAGLITTISFLYMRNQLRPITRFVQRHNPVGRCGAGLWPQAGCTIFTWRCD